MNGIYIRSWSVLYIYLYCISGRDIAKHAVYSKRCLFTVLANPKYITHVTHAQVEAEDDLRGSRVAQQQRADAEASVLKADLRLLEAELRQTQKELVASKAE
jgi:hypothetical protein